MPSKYQSQHGNNKVLLPNDSSDFNAKQGEPTTSEEEKKKMNRKLKRKKRTTQDVDKKTTSNDEKDDIIPMKKMKPLPVSLSRYI